MTIPTYALPNTATVSQAKLDNGITVLVYENPTVESVVIQGSLRAGSIYEPLERSGIASMVAASVMRGTQSRDFDTIHSTLEDIGAELEYGTGQHRLNFSGRALAEDLNVLVDMLADSLFNPIFPEDEIEEERRKRITELKYAEQSTRYMSATKFRQALYPENHPAHYSSYGSLTSLPQITSNDLRNFHQSQYGPDEMLVVVVGAVEANDAIHLVADALGDWHNPQQSAVPVLPELAAPHEMIHREVKIAGKTQSDIVLGTIGPSRYAEDYMAASIANSILGEFGMMGRVGNVIREQLGLAYYAYSRLEGGETQGSWAITAGVAPENVELTIEKARGEIQCLISELVSEDDLNDNQSYFTGRLPLRLESNFGLASTIHAMMEYHLGLDYLLNYHDLVFRVSREDVLKAAQQYLHPEHLVIAVAGS
jgi:zinc protease